jgi:hypothetical protein
MMAAMTSFGGHWNEGQANSGHKKGKDPRTHDKLLGVELSRLLHHPKSKRIILL